MKKTQQTTLQMLRVRHGAQNGLCLLLLGLFTLWPIANAQAGITTLEISPADQISADLTDVPLRKVLRTLATKGHISVLLDNSLNSRRVTVRFENLPMEEGIKKLITPYSSAMTYKKITPPAGPPTFKITELKVFDKGNATAPDFALIGQSDSGLTGKTFLAPKRKHSPADNLSAAELAAKAPAEIRDPATRTAIQKQVSLSTLTMRISHKMATLRQLESKIKQAQDKKQREIQALTEKLASASAQEAEQLHSQIARLESDQAAEKALDNSKLQTLERELSQLRASLNQVRSGLAESGASQS